MSLYDDDDDDMMGPLGSARKIAPSMTGWSQGVVVAQKQQLQQENKPEPAPPPPEQRHHGIPSHMKPSINKSKPSVLTPVRNFSKNKQNTPINLIGSASKKEDEESSYSFNPVKPFVNRGADSLIPLETPIEREYDPMWPNDYEKVKKEMREAKKRESAMIAAQQISQEIAAGDKEDDKDDDDEKLSGKRRYLVANQARARERFNNPEGGSSESPSGFSGFGGRHNNEEEEEGERTKSSGAPRGAGAAIAPPPSLSAGSSSPPISIQGMNKAAKPGLGIAAKIMAKYGYKEGSGLGRTEQGISSALQVEKTSKRGGRIIRSDLIPEPETTPTPPPVGVAIPPPILYDDQEQVTAEGAEQSSGGGGDEYGGGGEYGGVGDEEYGGEGGDEYGGGDDTAAMVPPLIEKPKPSITEMMRCPSKVVLMKNMVGPGEVDEELEPEVKEECEGKYGEIIKAHIVEVPNVEEEEAVRIFLEFKRVESAIKALVDLNGRFFGGREVQACFYNVADFHNNKFLI